MLWRRCGAGLARAAALGACIFAASCVQAPKTGPVQADRSELGLKPVGFDAVPGWQNDAQAEALPSLTAACQQMLSSSPPAGLEVALQRMPQGRTLADWEPACTAARQIPRGDASAARRYVEAYFQPFAVVPPAATARPAPLGSAASGSAVTSSGTGLVTGYYEPEVSGSRSPGGAFRVPLLGRPTDLVQADLGTFSEELRGRRLVGRVESGRLVPYFDRSAIGAGALKRQRLEFLWLADPIDAFFLQLQGAGRVRLGDGRVVRVGYAGSNGRPNVLIGKILVDRGELRAEDVSLQTIRAWLVKHTAEAQSVMDLNPSFVFFRELSGVSLDEGSPGTLGIPLVPYRSIAVDPMFVPLGVPVFIAAADPLTGAPIERLTVAADTGGAIKGPARADFFFGWGRDAEERAGRMRAQGRMWLLLPRPATPPRSG